jgi:hypothetical protein
MCFKVRKTSEPPDRYRHLASKHCFGVDLFILTKYLRYDLAKEAELPARFLGKTSVPIGRFEVLMNLIDSPSSFKSLKIRSESSTGALTNLTTSGVEVGAIFWRLKLQFNIDTNYLINDIGF